MQYDAGAWKQKHDQVVALVSTWKAPIARVRVELPTGAKSLRPPLLIQRGSDWLAAPKNGQPTGDVLVFIDKQNEQLLFQTEISKK